jgi:hypothetical protein
LRNSLEKVALRVMDLNHLSLVLGILVAAIMVDSDTSSLMVPTFVLVPSKFKANSPATSGCPLYIF